MTKSDRLHVPKAKRWLKKLQRQLQERDDESPQSRGLSQLFTIYEARLKWDERIGVFDHAIAVLSVDNQVFVAPGPGLTAAWLRLAIPGIKPTRVSQWTAVLNALWSNELDFDELQTLGIYGVAKRLRLGSAHQPRLGPLPRGRQPKDLRRDAPAKPQ